MEITIQESKPAVAKTLRMHLKVADQFTADILDASGKSIGGQDDGYVPDFMPGDHYGDYVMLDIDLDTGMVTNWKRPRSEQIETFIAKDRE